MKGKSLFFLALVILFCFGVFGLTEVGAVVFENPFAAEDFQEFVDRIVGIVWVIAIVIVPGLIILGAFYLLTSFGDPAKIKVGQNIILYTVIGFVIIMVSGGIIDLLRGEILEIGHPRERNRVVGPAPGQEEIVPPPELPSETAPPLVPERFARLSDRRYRGDFRERYPDGRYCPAGYGMCTLVGEKTIREGDLGKPLAWIDGGPYHCRNWTAWVIPLQPDIRGTTMKVKQDRSVRETSIGCGAILYIWCCPQ
ncbi:MAG: hypothetical protein KYQ20_01835 [Candidatus Nealsonbacteria bacterium]|nr:hypothetical protein [Candidatus Nealsonbacteria bacterium]